MTCIWFDYLQILTIWSRRLSNYRILKLGMDFQMHYYIRSVCACWFTMISSNQHQSLQNRFIVKEKEKENCWRSELFMFYWLWNNKFHSVKYYISRYFTFMTYNLKRIFQNFSKFLVFIRILIFFKKKWNYINLINKTSVKVKLVRSNKKSLE